MKVVADGSCHEMEAERISVCAYLVSFPVLSFITVEVQRQIFSLILPKI